MASADYRLCDLCQSKCFYDATLGYDFEEYPETGLYSLGAWVCLCTDCAKVYEIKIKPKSTETKN